VRDDGKEIVLGRFAASASARERCAASYNRARTTACAACWATEVSSARYSSSKFTGTVKWNDNTPIAEPSTRRGSAAAEAYPPSAAIDAERGYCCCHSAKDPMNTGRRVSTAAVEQRPESAGKRCHASMICRGCPSAYSVSNSTPPVSKATDPADAPATTLPSRTMTLATASSVAASDSLALRV
jgi:hypothetical protein